MLSSYYRFWSVFSISNPWTISPRAKNYAFLHLFLWWIRTWENDDLIYFSQKTLSSFLQTHGDLWMSIALKPSVLEWKWRKQTQAESQFSSIMLFFNYFYDEHKPEKMTIKNMVSQKTIYFLLTNHGWLVIRSKCIHPSTHPICVCHTFWAVQSCLRKTKL